MPSPKEPGAAWRRTRLVTILKEPTSFIGTYVTLVGYVLSTHLNPPVGKRTAAILELVLQDESLVSSTDAAEASTCDRSSYPPVHGSRALRECRERALRRVQT